MSEKVFTFAESIGSVGHVPDHVRLIGKTDVSTERESARVRRVGEKKENFGELALTRVFLRARVNETVKKALLLTTCGLQGEIY